jgi:ribonuclease G
MSKEIYISSTPHETRLAIVENDGLSEIYYERENEYTLAGSIYNGRVTRVLPGMQSSFVDIGLERDAFLYITDFMEEAAVDTAAFDTGSDEGRRREPRAPREGVPGAVVEARAPRGDRDRGARDAGRDGRGRNRRGRDGRGRGERKLSPPVEEFVAPVVLAPVAAEPVVETVGEGMPGADGARRWGGRKKRGFLGGLFAGLFGGSKRRDEEEEPIAAPAPVAAPVVMQRREPVAPSVPVAEARVQPVQTPREARGDGNRSDGRNESRGDGRREGGRERGGRRRGRGGERRGERGENRGEVRPVEQTQAAPVAAPVAPVVERGNEAREPRGDREGRGGRGRRDGRRGRGGERGNDRGSERSPERGTTAPMERDGERHAAIRERFAPRGPRPGGREREDEVVAVQAAAVPVSSAPEPEPFILPGESLSKYKRGEASASHEVKAPVANLVAAKPSTEVEPLVGWDGGAVLPGETLSRRREPVADTRGEGRSYNEHGGEGRGSDRRRERDQRRGGRQEFAPASKLEASEAVQPAVSSGHEFDSPLPMVNAVPGFEAEQPVHEAAIAAALESHEAAREYVETTHEYEPGEEASASLRAEPTGVSEFRQDAVLDEPVAEEHTFTAVQPTGEMLSEVHEPVAHVSHEAAPVEHEHAVQQVSLHEAAHEAVPFAKTPQGYAPGEGQFEEELLDDEDSDPVGVHASATEEEMEEEALEHGATREVTSESGHDPDLGSMLRDMSIDEMTHLEPSDEDEEDADEFEDEDFEEDELAAGESEAFQSDEVSGSEVSEREEEAFAEAASIEGEAAAPAAREGRRGRRDGRRGRGRDRQRGAAPREVAGETPVIEAHVDAVAEPEVEPVGAPEGEKRERSGRDGRGMRNSRGYNGGGRERGRQSMQATDLPSISDLLKPGQEVLVQIAKEPMAKKGARITSHIALPGRFLVFMPTVGHVGVSRKIESDAERRRLKEILVSERGEASGGFIVRTAAAGASEEDLRSDLRFLINLWADIKARSDSSKSPALIYHDLNLIERILRDQVTDNFSAIWVDTESEYERVIKFLQRFQPALVRRVKLYEKETPLFEQFGINAEINKALQSKVWLKSGGSIVINQTEALVAIDINTGKYVGKTARLEDTIVKTNLDAIEEIVRQIRLRDLGGIIIIDFIDMDERKNRNRVMAALEEELKKDRAPSKVLQFNDFGLVAITRKRVKQSLERTLSTTCGVCAGTGMTKSPVTVCNDLWIEMKKNHKTIEKKEILLRVNPEVTKQLKLNNGKWLTEMEAMTGKTILLKSDPILHPEQFEMR